MAEIRNRTKEKLLEEIEGLVIRLNRAEDALISIRNGNGQNGSISEIPEEGVNQLPFPNTREFGPETLNEGFLVLQQNGEIVYSNKSFSEMLGIPVQKLLGFPFFDLVRRDKRGPLKKLLEGCSQKSFKGESHLVSSDGGFLPVFISAGPGTGDNIPVLVLSLESIKNAENMLREERKRIFDILDEIPGFIYILSPDHKIRFVNRYFRENFGDTIGRFCFDVLRDQGSPCTDCPAEKVIRKQTIADQEFITRNNRTYHVFTYPMQDLDGSPLIFQFGLDMTEQKKSEKERAQLVAAIEFSAEGIMIVGSDGLIEYVNPAFEQITGFSKQEIQNRNFNSLSCGNVPDGLWEQMKQGNTWTGQLKGRKKDGSEYEEEMSIAPLKNGSGEILNYVVVKRDITEKLRLESLAEAINTMNNIGYVFSGIRHEIGNPVNSMKMTLNVLKSRIDFADREFINEYVDRALSELSRVEYLLKALKNFNMFEVPDMKKLMMDSFIRVFISLVSADFENKGIRLELEISPHIGTAYADPRALQQVLLNVLTNSTDALQGRPDPKIEIKLAKISGKVMIRISDNGCGMSQKDLKELFMPFFTTKPHGTGLGLMLVKKMLSKMRGSIQVTSQLGQGTVVDIFLQEETD